MHVCVCVCVTKDSTCSQVKGKSRAQSIRTTATERMKKVTNILRDDCRRGEIISIRPMTVYFCYDINYTLLLYGPLLNICMLCGIRVMVILLSLKSLKGNNYCDWACDN